MKAKARAKASVQKQHQTNPFKKDRLECKQQNIQTIDIVLT